jgi:hypothetical protein
MEVDPDNFLETYFLCSQAFNLIRGLMLPELERYIKALYFSLQVYTPGVPRILTSNLALHVAHLRLITQVPNKEINTVVLF